MEMEPSVLAPASLAASRRRAATGELGEAARAGQSERGGFGQPRPVAGHSPGRAGERSQLTSCRCLAPIC